MEWLAVYDPRVVQGALTLCAAVVASGTALWIAYKAYPRQKQRDEAIQIRGEKRAAYASYFSRLIVAFNPTADWSDAAVVDMNHARHRDLRDDYVRLLFYAPRNVAEASREVYGELDKYIRSRKRANALKPGPEKKTALAECNAVASSFRVKMRNAVKLARADILGVDPREVTEIVLFKDLEEQEQ